MSLRMKGAAVCNHPSVMHLLGNFSAKNKPVLRYLKHNAIHNPLILTNHILFT